MTSTATRARNQYETLYGRGWAWGKKKKGGASTPSYQEQIGTGEEGDYASQLHGFMSRYAGKSGGEMDYFRNFFPLFAANLLRTDAAKNLMDPQKMTEMAYRPGAAAIATGTEQGLRGARGSLAMSGLSSSGAYPMLEAQMRMQAAGMQGNLYTGLMQQNMQNSFNMQRDVMGMGMGQPPSGGGGGGGGNQWAGPLAQAAGSFAGWYLGGGGGMRQGSGGYPQGGEQSMFRPGGNVP